MLTHADYHATRPLTKGVTLAELLSPKIHKAPAARTINPLGKEPKTRAYEQSMAGVEAHKTKAHEERLATYRPAMFGKGWMQVSKISKTTGKAGDSVRQRLIKLIDSGHVELKKNRNATVHYRWIGS